MNILKQMNEHCKMYASLLGDYQSMSVEELMDGYCKALDEGKCLIFSITAFIGALIIFLPKILELL